jgi:uncharacterized protein
MKRWISLISVFTLILILTTAVFGLEVPSLKARVTDLAGVISPTERMRLEEKLYYFETQTSNQIAVLIIPSLEGEALEDYSIRVTDAWKLGDRNKENGVLLLIVTNERKIRIEVGYGLEGALTDLVSAQIIRNEIAPHFRQGNYYAGIAAGLNGIMLATRNEYKADPRQYQRSRGENRKSFGSLIFTILFFLFLIGGGRRGRRGLFWALLGASMFRSGGGSGGGGFGGFSGGGGGFGGGGASGGW